MSKSNMIQNCQIKFSEVKHPNILLIFYNSKTSSLKMIRMLNMYYSNPCHKHYCLEYIPFQNTKLDPCTYSSKVNGLHWVPTNSIYFCLPNKRITIQVRQAKNIWSYKIINSKIYDFQVIKDAENPMITIMN